MNRLARCPECGGVTHPLAEHLAAADGSKTVSVPATNSKPQTKSKATSKTKPAAEDDAGVCDNCGEPLGKLQKPFEWDGHFVCGPCHRMLSLDKTAKKVEAAPAPIVDQGIQAAPSAAVAEPVVVNARKKPTHPSELALVIRTICIGMCIIALTLYVIVAVLQSLGSLIMWGAIAIVVLAAIYWVRKGVLALRRRVRGTGTMMRE
ncbi:MAG TPA: hypothetical protein VFE47_27915 [Tepidisphaeraceae bacterium]|jgi:hypothetical protein|nr:hypothetical protein [Tepidisphaeraceae bacterium]